MKTNTIGMLMVAAGLGFIAGILLAPDKGTNTRRMLADKARDLAERLDPETMEHRNRQEEYEELLGV